MTSTSPSDPSRTCGYRFCNLVLASDEPLPELAPATRGEPDLWVQHEDSREERLSTADWFMHWDDWNGNAWLSCGKAEGGYLLRFHELADFFVDSRGCSILCAPRTGVPSDTIRHLLLDQVVPLVVNLKGGEALHASAVQKPEGAVAFCGLSGSGKSTLAASFLRAGCPLLSDDCLVLELAPEGVVQAVASYPGLRLGRNTLTRLFGMAEGHPRVAHYTDKRRMAIPARQRDYCAKTQPLRRIYLLSDPAEAKDERGVTIRRLSLRDGLMGLVRSAFRLDIQDRNMLKRQLLFLERVVKTVPVRRLCFSRELELLPAVHEAIERDMGADEK